MLIMDSTGRALMTNPAWTALQEEKKKLIQNGIDAQKAKIEQIRNRKALTLDEMHDKKLDLENAESVLAEMTGEVDMKKVDMKSIVISGVDKRDCPDYVDAFIQEACFLDGSQLSDSQLETLQENIDMSELAAESLR